MTEPTPESALDDEGVPAQVRILFERLAFETIEAGRARFSSDAILHRIRWYFSIEKRDDTFKVNNNWTAILARWFMAKHPEHAGFFETRERIGGRGRSDDFTTDENGNEYPSR